MKSIKNINYQKLSIIIIIIGILIRFYLSSIHHVAGDACWQLSNSRFIAENRKLPLFENFGRDEPFWAPPLFHIVSAFVYLAFNKSEFAVKMISPVFGSLTLIFFYLIAKKLFDKKIAFYSTIFLAFIPLHIDYSVFAYIDGMLTFLAALSIYFALNNRIISSAISLGLAILTKYNGIFILPALLYIIYSNNKNTKNKNTKICLQQIFVFLLISMSIGSIWFVRNWVYLGNPVWPFMNSLFHGIQVKSFARAEVGAVKISNIFNINAIKTIYLGIFGVPDGNIRTLSFVQMPNINILFSLWLIATIIFLIPLFIGFFSKKLKCNKLLFIWVGSYVVLLLLYVINASWNVTRFALPAFPALALIWGNGFAKIRASRAGKIFSIIILLIIVGFVVTSFIKIFIAGKAWSIYNDDFEWIKSNTRKDSVFLTGSQCISFNINRQTASPEIENLEKADYAFVNQNFKLDNTAKISDNLLFQIKSKGKLAYSNEKTKTYIYKVLSE